jgi:transcriptional regulator with XRE-family HTH domain
VPARSDTAADGPTDSTAFGQRLRLERERQNIGVRELSRQLDVSASMISQIERGRVMPSVNTLYSITSALGISLDDLFAREPVAPRPRAAANGGGPPAQEDMPADGIAAGLVQRREGRKAIELGSGVRWELLTTHPQANVEFLQTTYAVGGESAPADALMRHGGHEYGVVLSGRLGVTVGFETYELEPGDSISFTSSTPHRLFNLHTDEVTTAIWVVVGRRGDPRTA